MRGYIDYQSSQGAAWLQGLCLTAALAGMVPGPAIAQEAPQDDLRPVSTASLVESGLDGAVAFEPVKGKLGEADIQVFGGVDPKKGDWSSIAITKTGDGVEAFHCTATLVGRNAVLTAAHCVVSGTANVPAPLKIGDLIFRCTVEESYLNGSPGPSGVRNYFDYALCAAAPEAYRPLAFEQMRWDRIDLNPVTEGRTLLAAGYGCTEWAFTPGSTPVPVKKESRLSVGNITVAKVDEDYFTSVSDGATRSALCAGDSGGPAFAGVTVDQLTGARTIQGIASKNPPVGGGITSYFTALSSRSFRRFLACWIERHPNSGIQVKPLAGQTLGDKC